LDSLYDKNSLFSFKIKIVYHRKDNPK